MQWERVLWELATGTLPKEEAVPKRMGREGSENVGERKSRRGQGRG